MSGAAIWKLHAHFLKDTPLFQEAKSLKSDILYKYFQKLNSIKKFLILIKEMEREQGRTKGLGVSGSENNCCI